MNPLEQYAFDMHMKNINTKYEEFAKEITALQSPETFSMLYATDVHYIRKYAYYVPSYYKVKEMTEFSEYAGIDLLALTGDLVDGNTTLERQYRDMYDLISLVRKSKTTSVALSKGNHDDCSWYAIKNGLGTDRCVSAVQWYNHVVNPIRVQYPITLDSENPAGGYYYIDYPQQKIRVINLNTNDIENITDENGKIIREYCGHWCMGLREKQLKWLANALKFDEEGWSVMLMSHALPINDGVNSDDVKNGELAWKILLAYKNGEKGRVSGTEKYYEADVEYDFTQNKSNDVLPYLYGHVHRDMVITRDGITAIASDCILDASNPEGRDGEDANHVFDNLNINICGGWDCITIDKTQRTLKKRRFGVPNANLDISF